MPLKDKLIKNRGTLALCYIKICCTLRVIITDLTASFLYCKLYIDIVKDFFQIDDTKIQSNAVFFLVEILHLFEEYLQNNVIGRFFHFYRCGTECAWGSRSEKIRGRLFECRDGL